MPLKPDTTPLGLLAALPIHSLGSSPRATLKATSHMCQEASTFLLQVCDLQTGSMGITRGWLEMQTLYPDLPNQDLHFKIPPDDTALEHLQQSTQTHLR